MHERAAAGAALREKSTEARAVSQAAAFASAAATMGSMDKEMHTMRRTLSDPLAANLDVLGLPPMTRNVPTIRTAYHRRALTTHPDKSGATVATAFLRLQAAYDRLKTKIEGLH